MEDSQYELLSRLRDHGILAYEIHQLLGEVRRTGNSANHALAGDHRTFKDEQTFWENLATEAEAEKFPSSSDTPPSRKPPPPAFTSTKPKPEDIAVGLWQRDQPGH